MAPKLLFITIGLIAFLVARVALADPITFEIDAAHTYPISPLIYGANFPDWRTMAGKITATRLGGNRMTAYNWETNASNAGSDWNNQNDAFMGKSDVPGETVRKFLDGAIKANAAAIVTVPTLGYVAADKGPDGDVNRTPDFLAKRFNVSLPSKGAAFAYPPDVTDRKVFQDEFVNWVQKNFVRPAADAAPIFYALDNEPDLWKNTHSRIHPHALTYDEVAKNNAQYTAAIKKVAPKAQVVGLCSFGWSGWHSLQNAPDAKGLDFFDFYCQQMRLAEKQSGKRLIDVIDIHYYTEARGGGARVIDEKADPAIYAARIQAPRSLWDPTYRETSWIVNDVLHEPMAELRRLRRSIDANYPGTKLALCEYDFGGAKHISGAIAEADALGIFGREGIYLATNWREMKEDNYVYAGFRAFRDYDGQGAAFGATGMAVTTTADAGVASLYASRDEHGRLVLVAINKTDAALPMAVHLKDGPAVKTAAVYRIAAGQTKPQAVSHGAAPKPLAWELPAMSISTIVLEPAGK